MAELRWLLVFLLWAALDLSGPFLLVPVEVFEESEEAAHRAQVRRRAREPEGRPVSFGRPEVRDEASRLSRFVAAAAPHREGEAGTVRKLPPSSLDPDSASDDH